MTGNTRMVGMLGAVLLASCGTLIGLSDVEDKDEEVLLSRAGSSAGGATTGGGGGVGMGGTSDVGGMAGSKNTGGVLGHGARSNGGSSAGGIDGSGGTTSSGGKAFGGKGGSIGSGGSIPYGGSGGVPTNCTELSGITFSYFDLSSASTNYYYYMTFSPALGAADDDLLSLEFFDGSGYDGALTGSFTLGQGNEANYATCSRCVMVRQDALAAGQVNYFATAGTMTVSPSSAQMSGSPDVTLTDVTLVQVTVDPTTYVSTPVQQGSCLHLSSATLAGWMCNPSYSSDLDCDCGCGVVDSACASQTAMCDFCWCGTSCNPSNNAQCL